jgi:hypothetical protein
VYGGEYIPDWFLLGVLIVVIIFAAVSYWLSSGRVDLKPGFSDRTETKGIYFENPVKMMTRPVAIMDMKTNHIGQMNREYNSVYQMIISLILPNYFVRIKGTDSHNQTVVKVQKVRGRKGLVTSRWEVQVSSPGINESFLLNGESKGSKHGGIASFIFQGELIEVTKKYGENSYYFYKGDKEAAIVSIIGKLPPRRIYIDGCQGEMPLLLTASIFEALKLYR